MSTSATEPAPPGRVWRFDDFVLDTARYQLRRGDTVIRVEPQVFDVMTQLVSHHDRFLTKEELFDSVWGGRFVGEAALTSRIKAARRALGDDGESQRYIRTVRGRGYPFVGTVADEFVPPQPPAVRFVPAPPQPLVDRGRISVAGLPRGVVRVPRPAAWAVANDLVSELNHGQIANATALHGKSESEGQGRMTALHGGRVDRLVIYPNL